MMDEQYKVPFVGQKIKGKKIKVNVPGSKSITNRALLIAAMADGTSHLKGCLGSEDAFYFLECLKTLGFPIEEEMDGGLGKNIKITGFGGRIPVKKAEIYVGSAGTAARFLVAMLAFSDGSYTVHSSEQMKKRPMQPLIDALRAAGAKVECPETEGHFPLYVEGIGNKSDIPDTFTVNIDKSSQFLSALMIAAGTFGKRAKICVTGTHGLGYVELTAEMIRSFGVCVEREYTDGALCYVFPGEGKYEPEEYQIEPDMSAAAYFYAMAGICGAEVSVFGVTDHMLQGDTEFLRVLQQMGCTVSKDAQGMIFVCGPLNGSLKGGFTRDMSAFSDQALTLAAIAPFADAPITITGIGHIRLQECDRIHAITLNLTKMGISVEEKENAVTIYPGCVHGCEVETFEDHRVAMSFTLTGLLSEGMVIQNPSCTAKTFGEYFQVLEKALSVI